MNLHEVMLPKFHSMFSTYNVLLGQQVCMKCYERAKDNVVASTVTIKNEVERRKTKSQSKLHPM